jgi:hypothetical protein
MRFHDLTISGGSVYSRRQHDTADLLPAAVEVFRSMLERGDQAFRELLPGARVAHIKLDVTRHGTCALATFWSGVAPITTSALVSGLHPDDDRAVLEALQSLVLEFHRGTSAEPGFDLLRVEERPLLATMPIPTAALHLDMGLIADAETCLAAAFFLEVIGEA